jgi:hypothetical protein
MLQNGLRNMALNFKMINLKRIITKTNYFGEKKTVTDLSEPTLKPNFQATTFTIKRTVTVTDEYAMRPDLISMYAYGTDQYADLILKFNEISNPFSIAEGDVIIIPDLDGAKRAYTKPKPSKKEIEDVKRAYIDKNRFSKPTQQRLEKLQALANSRKNGSPTITTSNKLKPGESAITTKGGALIFAGYKSKPNSIAQKNDSKESNNKGNNSNV